MKTKHTNSILPLLCAAIIGILPSAFAQRIWDGAGGNNTWTNAANWGGTAPVATNTLTFSGTTQLTNVNNFTAGTVFNSIDFSAGAGAFNITGNSIGMASAGTLTNNSSNNQILNLAISGLGANSTITTGSGADITIGALNSAAQLNKRGLGTLTLGASTYTGLTNIGVAGGGDAGTVRFTGNKTNGNITSIFAGTLDINGNTFTAFSGGQALTLGNGTVGTSGNVNVGAGGVLNLNGGLQTFASTVSHTITGGTMNLNGATRVFAVANGGAATDLEISSVIADGNGTSSVTKNTQASTLLLSGNNTYTGVTLVGGTGTLAVNSLADGGSASGVGASSSAASNLLLRNGATLSYRGASNASTDRLFTFDDTTAGNTATISSDGNGTVSFTSSGTLAYTTTNQTRTLILSGTNGGNNTFNPTIADNGSGVVGVTKSGAGKWILSGASSYTGNTTVSAGTLLINGSTNAGSVVNVSSNATLGGNGTIGGNVNIATGAILSPGNSAGLLTIGGNLTLAAGSFSGFELDAITTRGGTFDAINVGGALTYNGTLVIDINPGTAVVGNYDLFNFTSQSGIFSAISFLDAGASGTFDYSTGVLNLTAIPEPSTWMLLAVGLAFIITLRRRRLS